jgi:SAM-dependent methyltransferase
MSSRTWSRPAGRPGSGSIVAALSRDFCTLFDVNYLPRGLVTHRSLRAVVPDARLRVLCMDIETKRVLDGLREPGVEAVALAELEAHDPSLAAVKGDRSRAEYCWTSTPALCRYLFDREPELEELSYIDADLMFWLSPEPLFEELGDDSVLIVPHRYTPQWAAQETTHGIYNVEWLTFRRDERGLAVLNWWRERCIEWCYARPEDGKFGDQKYLDDWPKRFDGIHVLRHPGGGLAPWNVPRHRLARDGESMTVDGAPLVFFHFHSLSLHRPDARLRALAALDLPLGPRLDGGVAWTTNYPVGASDREWIWRPYLRRLLSASDEVGRSAFSPLDVRKVLHPVAAAARRRAHEANEALRSLQRHRNGQASADDWTHGAAPEMLELVRRQLEAPETVPPFRGFRYALERVLADPTLERPVRLLDIGCGVGQYSELVDRWFGAEIVYCGCDVSPEMVAVAGATWPGRTFERDDVLDSRLDYDDYDVLLAGALVDVLAEWRPALDAILGSDAPYVILHRQRLTRGRTRVRRARGYAGGNTYRTVLSEADLQDALNRSGREIVIRLPIEPGIETFVLRRMRA